MKKIIVFIFLFTIITSQAQKKYDFHPEFDEIVSKADTLAFIKKDYKTAIELYKSVINTNGDYEDLLRCKYNCYKFLGSIYKSIDFEGHDFNLAYVYLKKAVEARDIFYKKAGFKSNYTSENDDLARRIDMLVKEYPGCENGTYVAQKNASTNTKSPINDVQNSSISSSNTQIDKPIANQEIKSDSTKQITKPTTERTVTITVSGSGKTQDEAKQSALRSAIEQAFGTFISAKTEILNDQVISDQITSVASGNIQAYDILNQSQLPDGIWGVTLKAQVSIDKLTSFVEAKGVSVEIKGGLFAMNIKQQLLNEQAEIKAIAEMVGLLHEPMQTAFDYSIKSGEPKSVDSESKNWEIPLIVTATCNKNIDFCAIYFVKTLKAISLTEAEVETYTSLNKKVFPIKVNYAGVTHVFNLRKEVSIYAIRTLVSNWEFFTRLFAVQSGMDESFGTNLFPNTNHQHDKYQPNIVMEMFDFSDFRDYDYDYEKGLIGVLFPTSGQTVVTFSWNDKLTLSQIEKITGYSVKPTGVVSNFKHGGYVVYEKDGHGLVIAQFDISRSHIFEDVKKSCDELVLNGYNDWRLPSNDELLLIYKNIHKSFGGFIKYWESRIYDYWSNSGNAFNFDSGSIYYNQGGNRARAIRVF